MCIPGEIKLKMLIINMEGLCRVQHTLQDRTRQGGYAQRHAALPISWHSLANSTAAWTTGFGEQINKEKKDGRTPTLNGRSVVAQFFIFTMLPWMYASLNSSIRSISTWSWYSSGAHTKKSISTANIAQEAVEWISLAHEPSDPHATIAVAGHTGMNSIKFVQF